MFNKNIKIVLAVLTIIWSGYHFYEGDIGYGVLVLLLTAILVLLYFKNEYILLSFFRLQKQDFPGATKWLDKIKNPETALVTKQQGYYNFLRGIMAGQTSLSKAEKFFKKALKLGLSMDHDVSMAKLQLAGIAITKRRKMEATRLLSEAKKLDKRGMLKDQIKQLKDQLKRI